MKMSEKLKNRMDELNIRATELARRSGASKSSVSQWLNSDARPSSRFLPELCRILQVDPEWFIDGVRESAALYTSADVPKRYYVPLYTWADIAPAHDDDHYAHPRPTEMILSPFEMSTKAFAMAVEGDAMEPDYKEGELILVDPGVIAEHNDDAIVICYNLGIYFRRVQFTREGDFMLALNPHHPGRKQVFDAVQSEIYTVIGSIRARHNTTKRR